MDFPALSHLQFAVLDAIGAREIKGREVRQALAKEGIRHSAPAFYQLMSRLEEAGFVTGSNEVTVEDGLTITERSYRLTGKGETAFRNVATFYARRAAAHGIFGIG
jgi:DNA-binding PadR family transcriptional regulator